MDELNTVDEGVIDADPATVFTAMEDLIRGKAQWWLPVFESTPREQLGLDLTGALVHFTQRRPRGPGITSRIVEVRRNELIRTQYVGGVLIGETTTTLEPVEGKTKILYSVRARPKRRIMRFLIPLIARRQANVFMPAYFNGLRSYLASRGPQHPEP